MNTFRALNISRIIFVIPYLYLLLQGCTGGPKEANKEKKEVTARPDSGNLFDGKTLNGWEITNFGPQGPVEVSGASIILGIGDGCTGITWKGNFPEINYEVTLEAMRVAGNDFFCGMTFPVGKFPCTLIIGGWGGTVVGLSCINGKDASQNETTTLRKFEKGRWYRIRLRVTEKEIKAWIDDDNVVNFTVDDKQLSIRPEVQLSRPFGIASWNTRASLREIRVRKLLQ